MSGGGFTLGELAEALRVTLEGDPSKVVTGVAALEQAGPEQISFLTDLRYRASARASRAGAFLAPPGIDDLPGPTLRSSEPQQALIELLTLFHPAPSAPPGVHPSAIVATDARVDPTASVGALAVVASGAVIGPRAAIHALVYIGAGVVVGADCVLYPQVVLREGVRLGARVIVHAGAVLGSDGFGYAFDGRGHRKIPQIGGVVIEDDVEIGANSAIDRAMLGETIVRRGTKIDNLVQIGHNVEIGENSLLVAQVGISGSCRLGRGVILAGQVGLADHIELGDGVIVGAQSGLHADVPAGNKVLGTPARTLTLAKRIFLSEEQLPDLLRRFRALERRVAELEGRQDGAGGADREH